MNILLALYFRSLPVLYLSAWATNRAEKTRSGLAESCKHVNQMLDDLLHFSQGKAKLKTSAFTESKAKKRASIKC